MKNLKYLFATLLVALCTMLSSCAAIAGIFKAGMGFGIFIVVVAILLIVVLAMRSGKSKN